MKIIDFKEISKDHLLARLVTLSNEQKITIKLFHNSSSFSVNEELIDQQTVNSMQYSHPRSSSVSVADTPVCNIIDDSPQQTPVTLKSLNKSYSDLSSQSIAIK